jgi:RNA polymerase sigma-B factor
MSQLTKEMPAVAGARAASIAGRRAKRGRGESVDYEDYPSVAPLFERYATLDAHDPERRAVRERLIAIHLPLATHIARRYANRGEPLDDLTQVAMVGLIKAIDRFDPSRGVGFLPFGVPTVMGEVRRYFRDHGWSVRIPRRLMELQQSVHAAIDELSERGRAPTAGELATHLGVTRDEVLTGLEATNAYHFVPLEAPVSSAPESPRLVDILGDEDPALEARELWLALRPALASLPPRERKMLALRFVNGQTQSQIANEIGVSQMQVSRLLAATLGKLRAGLVAEES